MRPYSQDLRQRVLDAVEAGLHTHRELAELFGVSLSWLTKLLRRWRSEGSSQPRPMGGDRRSALGPDDLDRLRQAVEQHPDATLAELREHAQLPGSLWATWRALRKLKITRKQKTLQADERDRPDVQQKRSAFRAQTQELDATQLVFVDESGADTALTRRYGRAPRGQRVVGKVPGDWDRLTIAAAMRLGGVVAALAYPGGTDKEAFATFAGQVLDSELREGDVVVWDNLSSHDQPRLVQQWQARGVKVVPLPPYSPDLTPIEKMWSKVKERLRKIGARTVETLYAGIAEALATVRPSDIRGWFACCGL